MTCSEVHSEDVTGLPREEWITGHRTNADGAVMRLLLGVR